jgi:putative IMPACT (imprinted ancient) family translation regulator
MLTPTKFYEHRAKDCVQAARRTDKPKHREQFLKLAYEWAQAAELRASLQSKPQRTLREKIPPERG